jgi:hypothetical protein
MGDGCVHSAIRGSTIGRAFPQQRIHSKDHLIRQCSAQETALGFPRGGSRGVKSESCWINVCPRLLEQIHQAGAISKALVGEPEGSCNG